LQPEDVHFDHKNLSVLVPIFVIVLLHFSWSGDGTASSWFISFNRNMLKQKALDGWNWDEQLFSLIKTH